MEEGLSVSWQRQNIKQLRMRHTFKQPLPKRSRNLVWRHSSPHALPYSFLSGRLLWPQRPSNYSSPSTRSALPYAVRQDRNQPHDILDDKQFALLLQLWWSGRIALACFAPPCKLYSRLRLRPGGPKALRTPEFMTECQALSLGRCNRSPIAKLFTPEDGNFSVQWQALAALQAGSNRLPAWHGSNQIMSLCCKSSHAILPGLTHAVTAFNTQKAGSLHALHQILPRSQPYATTTPSMTILQAFAMQTGVFSVAILRNTQPNLQQTSSEPYMALASAVRV